MGRLKVLAALAAPTSRSPAPRRLGETSSSVRGGTTRAEDRAARGKGAMAAADWWRGLRVDAACRAALRDGGDLVSASPRWVAYDVLRAVHTSDAYANLLLPRAIARAGLSGADAASRPS
jgi:hypothetical protein